MGKCSKPAAISKRWARRALNRSLAAALRLRSRPYPIEEDCVSLVLAPHEDDGTLGCGGLILLKRLEGLPVRVAYLTDGSASHPNHPELTPEALSRLRREEALAASAVLGVERAGLYFLEAPDGRLNRLEPEAAEAIVARLAEVIERAAPDEILLPYRRDRSSEHEAAFGLVARALARSGHRPRLLEYPIWSWWDARPLFRPLFRSRRIWRAEFRGYEQVKLRALAAYATQIRPTPPWDKAVLSPEFVSYFSAPEEFFFEMT